MHPRRLPLALLLASMAPLAAQAEKQIEYRPCALTEPQPAVVKVAWQQVLKQPAPWYTSAEACAIAAAVRQYQTESGGWTKNQDMTAPPDAAFLASTAMDHRAPTIDNGATTTQIRFLATVAGHPAPDAELNRAAAIRGLEYLLAAQYANGGWPQYYPLQPGYYTHITFNDDAMVHVLDVLRDVAAGKQPFAWTEPALRARAAAAVEKGIACILRCQIVVAGKRTVWCAQHDEITFEPVPARAYEHVSLSGSESVGIVRFLLSVERPSPEIVAAIEGAVAWFETAKLTGIRVQATPNPRLPHGYDSSVVADPAAPPLWARFYEIGTNRPIFGGRDTAIRYSLAEVEPERRGGYRWYSDEPAQLLARDYPRWQKKLAKQATTPAQP